MRHTLQLDTPVGTMTVTASEHAVTDVRFGAEVPLGAMSCREQEAPEVLRRAAAELREYFDRKRHRFTVPLAPRGSEFQQKVWNAMLCIEYGQTRTYKQIAQEIGHRRSFRAVGMASNRNPIAIFIPCHRVIGCDGKLTGYAAGLEIKEWLLDLEKGRQE